ncbi:MAG: DNA-directed RNA polymerase subunit omega [Acutalibacteraceae bacterium]|jgi:DNA-directed RNA polymerase subunit omega
MLNPNDIEKIQGKNSRYAVVIGVAKRAREISQAAEDESVILLEKPVSLAIKDFEDGDYKLVMEAGYEEQA